MRKAIIVGSSSGLGRSLAGLMAADGWRLALLSRNIQALEAMGSELGPHTIVRRADVTDPEALAKHLESVKETLGEVDCVVANAGIGELNPKLEWEPEARTIATNVAGFTATVTWAGRYFLERKRGHIVGISSVASLRGSPFNPAYNASKAFISNYLEGLRFNLGRFDVAVTDIRPGYVATPMTEEHKGMFWVADVDKAARQIYGAILKRRKVAYITKRWFLVALLAKSTPGWLYKRFSN